MTSTHHHQNYYHHNHFTTPPTDSHHNPSSPVFDTHRHQIHSRTHVCHNNSLCHPFPRTQFEFIGYTAQQKPSEPQQEPPLPAYDSQVSAIVSGHPRYEPSTEVMSFTRQPNKSAVQHTEVNKQFNTLYNMDSEAHWDRCTPSPTRTTGDVSRYSTALSINFSPTGRHSSSQEEDSPLFYPTPVDPSSVPPQAEKAADSSMEHSSSTCAQALNASTASSTYLSCNGSQTTAEEFQRIQSEGHYAHYPYGLQGVIAAQPHRSPTTASSATGSPVSAIDDLSSIGSTTPNSNVAAAKTTPPPPLTPLPESADADEDQDEMVALTREALASLSPSTRGTSVATVRVKTALDARLRELGKHFKGSFEPFLVKKCGFYTFHYTAQDLADLEPLAHASENRVAPVSQVIAKAADRCWLETIKVHLQTHFEGTSAPGRSCAVCNDYIRILGAGRFKTLLAYVKKKNDDSQAERSTANPTELPTTTMSATPTAQAQRQTRNPATKRAEQTPFPSKKADATQRPTNKPKAEK